MIHPCNQRPSSGIACAKLFARGFAMQAGRLPSNDEIKAHIKGQEYSAVHLRNIYAAARDAARGTLEGPPLDTIAALRAQLHFTREALANERARASEAHDRLYETREARWEGEKILRARAALGDLSLRVINLPAMNH